MSSYKTDDYMGGPDGEGRWSFVSRRDGERVSVKIDGEVVERYDTEMEMIAMMDQLQAREDQRKAEYFAKKAETEGTFEWVDSPAYGRGKRYHELPGAVHYDNGNGKYTVQIWD